MKKNEIEKIFKKLDLKVRSTGHNYGWLIINGKKILRVVEDYRQIYTRQ
jgi:hypothetical protein